MTNLYARLGVSETATASEIKKAYRVRALQLHPDTNNGSPEAAEKFKQVAAAYEVLSDTQKRSTYDRSGSSSSNDGFGGLDFEDFCSYVFSGVHPDHTTRRTKREEKKQTSPNYVLMESGMGSYAQGVHALRAACVAENNFNQPKYHCPDGSSSYRPLTFREGIIARLTDFNTLTTSDGTPRSLDDRLELFLQQNDSCTGIVTKAGTTRFKIIPLCKELIMIDERSKPIFQVAYDSFDVPELDRKKGVYNSKIPRDKIVDNEGWRFALEHDIPLLRNYVETVLDIVEVKQRRVPKLRRAMSFNIAESPTDELRELFVNRLDFNFSDAIGDSNLDYFSWFVRKAPRKKDLLSVEH